MKVNVWSLKLEACPAIFFRFRFSSFSIFEIFIFPLFNVLCIKIKYLHINYDNLRLRACKNNVCMKCYLRRQRVIAKCREYIFLFKAFFYILLAQLYIHVQKHIEYYIYDKISFLRLVTRCW